jgi:hypothetical protein
LSIFDKVSEDVLKLTKILIDRKFYDASEEYLRYAVERIDLIPTYRLNIIEFAIASLSYPTWCIYHCLISAADTLDIMTKDLARLTIEAPEHNVSNQFVYYVRKLTDFDAKQVLAQTSFLLQATSFVNKLADQRCFEHCQRKCREEHPVDKKAYRECLIKCLDTEKC